jgi:Subtilase family
MNHPPRWLRTFFSRTALLLSLLAGLPLLFAALPAGPVGRAAALPVRVATEEQASEERIAVPAVGAERLQHLGQLGARRWHEAGYRGRGVKVALLDSGWRGYRDHLGKALPAQVHVRSFRTDGNLEARDSQHGILCGEVVHTVAPEAELLFANWEPDQPDTFLNAVRWARAQGACVISCSCIMPGWSDGDGGGAVHDALARILGSGKSDGDALFFGCAGNTALRHWLGVFHAGAGGFHEWVAGQKDNPLSPWGKETVSVELYSRPGAAYELTVFDQTAGGDVARMTSLCIAGHGTATARFLPRLGHRYRARVRLVAGMPGPFHLMALHSGLEHATAGGSICFPGDGRSVIAVGAVTRDGRRCAYSACGPNSPLPKPDLVAPVPFASAWRGKSFAGTSAATPQAAALAALLWGRHRDWTADLVRSTLYTSARDLGPRGHDWETGYGLVQLR